MKRILIFLLAFIAISPLYAQQYGYKWRFGVSAGTTNYIGDIRPFDAKNFEQFAKLYKRYDHYSEKLSYQFSAEYALGKSVGLMLTAGTYQFGSGDRFVENDGSLNLEGENFDRALNFQTDLQDAGLALVLKPDNDWLLSGKSFFAPYLVIGGGMQQFKVQGDLLDASGNRYDYTNSNVIPDGTFETNLRDLKTELPGDYKESTFYAHLGLGFRFRIMAGVELFAQSDFKRTATGYLDDVDGMYRTSYDTDFQEYAAKPGTNVVNPENPMRGSNGGRMDWYVYHGVGVKFSLGVNRESFNPPVISQRHVYVPTQYSPKQIVQADSTLAKPNLESGATNNYFTVIQLPSWEKNKSMASGIVLDSMALAQWNAFHDSLTQERTKVQVQIRESQTEIEKFEQAIVLARLDTGVSTEVTKTRIIDLENEKSIISGQLTSLNFINSQLHFKLDSLNAVQTSAAGTYVDTVGLTKELLIYPGQVSRILYSSSGPTSVYFDSMAYVNGKSVDVQTYSDPKGVVTRTEFENKMNQMRSEMLQSQATRDSTLMKAFALGETSAQKREVPQGDNAEKVNVNSSSTENPDDGVLKEALLVGGAVAATAAVSNSGDKKKETAQAERDSLLTAQIEQDSLLIDSLQLALGAVALTSTMANSGDAGQVQRDSLLTAQIKQDSLLIDSLHLALSAIDEIRIDTVLKEKLVLINSSTMEVYFAVNDSGLSESEAQRLDLLTDILNKQQNLHVQLMGFADNTGSISYNLQLSAKRVESVKAYLIAKGVLASRIVSDVGGLIVRGGGQGSVDSDRKVEVRIRELK